MGCLLGPLASNLPPAPLHHLNRTSYSVALPPDLPHPLCLPPRSDFVWATFKTEWNTYEALGGRGLPWVAEAFEYGLVQTGQGVAPW